MQERWFHKHAYLIALQPKRFADDDAFDRKPGPAL